MAIGLKMLHELLKGKQLVLASASPRRKEIFKLVGLKFLTVAADIDETITDTKPYILVCRHAMHKALAVAAKMDADTVVVGADTIVYLNSRILGKPKDMEQARAYLQFLSGNRHTVFSGISIVWQNRVVSDYAKSHVWFNQLSPNEIETYLSTGEPMDKAGAYGIQGYGSQFINRISGSYFNVMGFPVNLFYRLVTHMFQPIQ